MRDDSTGVTDAEYEEAREGEGGGKKPVIEKFPHLKNMEIMTVY